MKRNNKYLIIALIACFAIFQGCETLELDKRDNPNNLGPDQADATLLFNNIQRDYNRSVTIFNNTGGELSRIEYMFGRVYLNNYPGNTLNDPWGYLYSSIIPDIAGMESLNVDGKYDFIIGASKAMQAHLMMLMVDYMGDIVYSEANNPSEFPSPKLDDGASVYAAALSLLDEASALLQGSSAGTALDVYYGGSEDNWIKFINTLKMRAALTTGDYQAVVDASNVIETAADNLVYEYGTNELSPDSRHPDYATDYNTSGADNYRSNWLMDLMIGVSGDNTGDDDPRRRYYFYRQAEFTPGHDIPLHFGSNIYLWPTDVLGTNENLETLVCSSQAVPNHLQFTAEEDYWCGLRLGYWGRTHGNAEGIPPDGFQRTASGVYPAGGRFDDNPDFVTYLGDGEIDGWNAKVGKGLGAMGQGIEPIILSSFVEFWRAEAYLKLNNPTMAATHFTAGVTESINYVTTFGPRDGTSALSLAPDADKIQDFIDAETSAFVSAAATTGLDAQGWPVAKDKMDILGEQFFVAMYGAGADAYNFIRRTGYPRTLARSLEANPGPFPRSLLYASDETGANLNIDQKTDLSTKVFWDLGVINPSN